MADGSEDRMAREHQELALLIAYAQDDYIRTNGTDHGSAQAVADAIQAAGFTKDPELTEGELELLRIALQVAIGRSKEAMHSRSSGSRSPQERSEIARIRRYRVLLEKLGGPKIPVCPVVS